MIKKLIYGFVDVVGSMGKNLIYSMVDVIDTSKNTPILNYVGQKQIGVSGIINENVNGITKIIPNVKVSFLQNNCVIDYCTTDKNGKYVVFIEPGTYTIRIDTGNNPKIYNNQTIDEGMNAQYYCIINYLIKTKYEDVIEFNKTDYKLISGTMINGAKDPISDAEIIITDPNTNEIISYIKTNKDGKYCFALKNGIYDIRIRSKNYPVKIIKNFNFENQKGFLQCLNEQSNLFGKGDWLWISQ